MFNWSCTPAVISYSFAILWLRRAVDSFHSALHDVDVDDCFSEPHVEPSSARGVRGDVAPDAADDMLVWRAVAGLDVQEAVAAVTGRDVEGPISAARG
jgi:hypothetical protein